ncbi:uncharacterized protein [Pseudorasbora parva]|uniref:uncharacterized protein isoform X2 n=1 Tax=Pseudorasbora parva TaxID=51549 RepID=UPI00351EDBF0
MEHLSAANTQFSLNLFKKISGENASGNVFYSPVSISSALAMVSLGARGNTADQMIKVLGFNNPLPAQAMMQETQGKVFGCGFRDHTPKMQPIWEPQLICDVKDQHTPSMMQPTQEPLLICDVKDQHTPSMMQQTQEQRFRCGVKVQDTPMMQPTQEPQLICDVKDQHTPSMMQPTQEQRFRCGVKVQDTPMMQPTQEPLLICDVKDQHTPSMMQQTQGKVFRCGFRDQDTPKMQPIWEPQLICDVKDQHTPSMMQPTREPQLICDVKDQHTPSMMQQTQEPLLICDVKDQNSPSMMQQTQEPQIRCAVKVQNSPSMMQPIWEPQLICDVKDQHTPSMMQPTQEPLLICDVKDQHTPSMMQQTQESLFRCGIKDQHTPSMMQQTQEPQIRCAVKVQNSPSMMQQTQEPQIPDEWLRCPGMPVQEYAVFYPEDQIHSSYKKFMSELNKPGVPYALSIANRLYGEQSYQFVEKFLDDAKIYYEAGLEKVDFKNKSEAVRVNINKWVEKKTQEKIKDLLPQGAIDAMTRLVLVNAIYFKGNWEKKFPKEATRDEQFKLNKNQTKPVKMMHQKAKFTLNYIPEMNSQVLELPYVGKNLSMLIILPNEIEDDTTGLQKLEKALTYEKLKEWTEPEIEVEHELEVSLPRFKMEEKYDMKTLLISMGMEDVFMEGKVNLSGMTSTKDLVVSKVIHKAFVELNEEGTEAAAATGVVFPSRCYIPPQEFIADHPFLFFIRHNPTKSILFYGRFCSP